MENWGCFFFGEKAGISLAILWWDFTKATWKSYFVYGKHMEKLWFPKGTSGKSRKSSTNDGCFLYLNLLGRTTGGWFTTRIFLTANFTKHLGAWDDPNQPIVLGPGRNSRWDVGRLRKILVNARGILDGIWLWWNAALPQWIHCERPVDVFGACWDGMKAAFLIRWKWMLP